MPGTYPLTLYYDAACPLCAAEMRNLKLRDAQDRLRLVDCSGSDFAAPPGFTTDALMRQLHAQTADGRVLIGVPAFEAAYAAAGLHAVVAALRQPLLRAMAQRLYPHLARHRQRLPRPLIQLMFGRALRQAAEDADRRAQAQRCGTENSACPLPDSPENPT